MTPLKILIHLKTLSLSLLAAFFLLGSQVWSASTAVTITSTSGDQSVVGSFGWAVTFANNNAGGVTIDFSGIAPSSSISMIAPLPVLTNSVTFINNGDVNNTITIDNNGKPMSITSGTVLSTGNQTDSDSASLPVSLSINGGTLQNGGIGQIFAYQESLNIGASGATIDTDANNATLWINGYMNGTGTLSVSGPGTLYMTAGAAGQYSYTGGTNIQGGYLTATMVGGSAALGIGPVTLDGGTLATDYRQSLTLSSSQNLVLTSNGGILDGDMGQIRLNGVVSGSGPLSILNGSNSISQLAAGGVTVGEGFQTGGFIVFGAVNTYTGGTYIGGYSNAFVNHDYDLGSTIAEAPVTMETGVLVTKNQGIITNRDLNLINFGVFDTDANNSEWNGVISGTGHLTVDDGGALTITNVANSYSGGTNVWSFSTVNVTDDRQLGATSGGVSLFGGCLQPGAAVTFDVNRTLYLGNKGDSNPGTPIIAGLQNYFDTAGYNSEWDGLVTGPGGLSLLSSIASGSLLLTQQATYLGNTVIGDYKISGFGGPPPPLAGITTLYLGLNNTLPTSTAVSIGYNGTLDLLDHDQIIARLDGVSTGLVALGSGILTVDGTTNGVFDGVITGTGSLVKDGTSTLTLNGVNTYSGGTTIIDGALMVGDSASPTASILGPVTVQSAGALEGSGAVYGTVNNNGTVAVSANSALSIINLVDTATSITDIHILPGTNNSGRLDLGTESLTGALTITADPGAYGIRYRYVIVNSNSALSGTYLSLTDNLSYMDASLIYGSNAVTLTMVRNDTDFTALALTPNQMAIGTSLNQSLPYATDPFIDKLNELYVLTGSDYRLALSQMGGSSYGALAPIMLNQTEMGAAQVFDQFSGSGEAAVPLDTKKGNSFWMIETNHFGTWNGDPGIDIMGFNTTSFGVIVGNDAMIEKGLKAGWTLSYDHVDLTATDSGGVQTGVDGFMAGVYGSKAMEGFELDGLIEAGLDQYSTTRTVALGSDMVQPKSTFNGNRVLVSARGLFPFSGGKDLSIKPFLGMQYTLLLQDGFTETGADSLDLTVAPQSYNSVRPVVGIGASLKLAIDPSSQLVPSLEASASREVAGAKSQTQAAWAGASGVSTTTTGATSADPTLFGLKAGLKLAVLGQFDVYTHYNGYLGGGQTSHIVNGGFDFTF